MFSVKFPENIGDSEQSQLRDLLKGMKSKNAEMADDDEIHKLIPYSSDQKNTDARGGSTADHEEEEDDDPRMRGGGQRVQCAQQ